MYRHPAQTQHTSFTRNISFFPEVNVRESPNANSMSSSAVSQSKKFTCCIESASSLERSQLDPLPVTGMSVTLLWTYRVRAHTCVLGSICVLCVHCVHVCLGPLCVEMVCTLCVCSYVYARTCVCVSVCVCV